MIRNTGPGKRLLAAGIVLILGMTGCGTDNELSLTGTEETGIEVMATVDFTEEAATGENAPDVTDGDAATGDAEQTTADRMAGRTKVKGIYVTGPKAGSAGMEDLIRLVDETELNAMVIDVKNDEGNLTFRLTNEEIPQDIPVLDRISEMQAGIRYIRDIQTMMQELQEIPEAERAVVRPWLQAFTATWVPGHISYNGTQIREQIQAVYDAGYEEWILWNATNRYSPDGLLAAGEEKQ